MARGVGEFTDSEIMREHVRSEDLPSRKLIFVTPAFGMTESLSMGGVESVPEFHTAEFAAPAGLPRHEGSSTRS